MTDLTVSAVDDAVVQLVRIHAERIGAEVELLEETLVGASAALTRRLGPAVAFGRMLVQEIGERVDPLEPLWCESCGEFLPASISHRCRSAG